MKMDVSDPVMYQFAVRSTRLPMHHSRMQYRLFHLGVLVAQTEIDISPGNDVAAELEILPGGSRFERIVRDGSRAFSNYGYLAPNAGFFGGVTTEGDRAGQIAMQRLFRLESEVELRDADDRRIQVKAFDALGTNPDASTAIVVSITFPDT